MEEKISIQIKIRKLKMWLFEVRNNLWFAGVERKIKKGTKTVYHYPVWSRVKSERQPLQIEKVGDGQVEIRPNPEDERLRGLYLNIDPSDGFTLNFNYEKNVWNVVAKSGNGDPFPAVFTLTKTEAIPVTTSNGSSNPLQKETCIAHLHDVMATADASLTKYVGASNIENALCASFVIEK
jgi:hypothetical protein